MKTFEEFGLDVSGKPDQCKVKCSKCSSTRKNNPEEECVSVNQTLGVGHCFHCGEVFVLEGYDRPKAPKNSKKDYAVPIYDENKWQQSEYLLDYFSSRGISETTLKLNNIGYRFGKIAGKETNIASFPYYKEDNLVNVGYRNLDGKDFRLYPKAEVVFYGLNDLVSGGFLNTKQVIIVEGQVDKLSFNEVGLWNVISVPAGSPFQEGKSANPKLEYLEDDYFVSLASEIDEFVIATDNDYAGMTLASELSTRLGVERCSRIKFGNYKDANEVLVGSGVGELVKLYQNRIPMLEGIVSDVKERMVSYYDKGLESGLETGLDDFDDVFTLGFGYVTLVTGIPEIGKAEKTTNLIPTTEGMKPIIELKSGDKVFNTEGGVCNVVARSEVWKNRPIYRVSFDDGSFVDVDGNHEWYLSSRKARISDSNNRRNKAKRKYKGNGIAPNGTDQTHKRTFSGIVSTKDIKVTTGADNRLNYRLDLPKPVIGKEVDLPIDPYILGAWLGDGNSDSGGFTSDDIEIVDRISENYRVNKLKGKYKYGIIGLKIDLRSLGVLGNKHIPEPYLNSSYSQRLDLIKGLMDTDGHIKANGSCEFSNSNKSIAYQFLRVIRSLGVKATIKSRKPSCNGKLGQTNYRITFTTDLPVFHLTRKLEKIPKIKKNSRSRYLYIKSVELIEYGDTVCIQVDSEDNLYLTGSSYIPTHNSMTIDNLLVRYCEKHNLHCTFYSPETKPLEFHISRLVNIHSGQRVGNPDDKGRIGYSDYVKSVDWVDSHFTFLEPKGNTLSEILALFKASILQNGSKVCVIDPFTRIRIEGDNEQNFIRSMLNELSEFADRYKIHLFIVAHPVKMEAPKGKNPADIQDYPIVKPYDIRGSGTWFDSTDFIISLWRTRKIDNAPIKAYILKSKYWHLAKSHKHAELYLDGFVLS